ncbi:MAG: phosphoenolpyruvate--protein phosphotransferase [Lentisphaeraceae bacterium]|nr:phosphoenolpyruvate--protein phosphotransferase [Lentisphaeraceae bacterium]
MLKDTVVDILKSVTDAILKHEDVGSILNKTVSSICQNLKVETCCIYTHDKSNDVLQMTASEGYLSKAVGLKLKADEGITGHVFQSKRQVNMANPETHPSFKYIKQTGEERFNSYLGIPMMAGNSCVGVLAIQSSRKTRFHEDIVDMAINLASQLAIVVANADIDRIFRDHSQTLKEKTQHNLGNGDLKIKGVPISSGVVYGQIFNLQSEEFWNSIEIRQVKNTEDELAKLDVAIESAKKETTSIQERASQVFIEADASIFFAQLLFLEDPNFVSDIKSGIQEDSMEAASSVRVTVEKYMDKFRDSNDSQLQERAIDLMDVGLRIVHFLIDTDKSLFPTDDMKMIFVGDDIMPSDLMRVSTKNILGIACEFGGSTSHAAILARSLAIPAVLGVTALKESCTTGDHMLIDGDEGTVILNPSKSTLTKHKKKLDNSLLEIQDEDFSEVAKSSDNKRVKVLGNICMVSDFNQLNRYQYDGVGLYRTEFMYMIHENFPSENEQYRIYRSVAKMASPNPVTIRALDIGGDKPLKYFDHPDEMDPMLGFRSLRILLQHREIFEPHLRAMLRASQRGNIKILFPMVAHYEDIIAAKEVLKEILIDLQSWYGTNFKLPPIGAMIEMPSTVWQIESIMQEIDYVSIGTNDLVQYMFAVDRGNGKVSNYFKPMHPIILSALKHITNTAKKLKKGVSLCGEIAGNPLYTPLLLGLGLRELSMPPQAIKKVKPIISKLNTKECRSLVKEALKMKTEQEVHSAVTKFLQDRELLGL